MKPIALLLAAAALAGAHKKPVGTFDRTKVVIAFYRSPTWNETLRAKRAEQDAARAAGDQKRVAALEKWGGAQQELAHRHLAGKTPLDNILTPPKPQLDEIAREAQVPEIREKKRGYPAGVDVTDKVVEALKK